MAEGHAQGEAESETGATGAQPPRAPEDRLEVRSHEVELGGQRLHYTTTTGTVVLREEVLGEGEREGRFEGHRPKAEVFFAAYTLEGVQEPATRPLTFVFNGGPGSSSVWLHLGLFGPKRVDMGEDGLAARTPYRLVPNEASLLDRTDLVFIDPVSTGYSRVVEGEKPKPYHAFDKDIESVAEFIRLYTSRNGRWRSPVFLAGESYGTTRAAGLAGHLQERLGLFPRGLMLVSSILDFSTALFGPGNDLPPLLFLPTYAATAHYHGRLPEDLQRRPLREVLDEVESFALERYAPALLKGSELAGGEREAIRAELARFTGLGEAYLDASDLRVDIFRFAKELLRDAGRTVGRIDSRYTGIDRDRAGEHFEFDPSMAATQGAYTAAFNDYVRGELGYASDLPYQVLANLYASWSYKDFENRYVNVAETLRKAISYNPNLRVHVANGYYDLATPYFATEHTLRHLALDPTLRANLSMSYYEAGHMMYVHRPSLLALRENLTAFLDHTTPR
ncbi:MAG: peptidase S10 [Deinococcales bacterium]